MKWAGVTSLLLVLLLLTPFAGPSFRFFSELGDMRRWLHSEAVQPLPETARALLLLQSHHDTAAQAARHLISRFDSPVPMHNLSWQREWASWSVLTAVFFSEDERLAIIGADAYMGNGQHGFSSAAQARYGKPLDQLSPEQAAELVELSHGGSYFIHQPEKLAEASAKLLTRYQAGER